MTFSLYDRETIRNNILKFYWNRLPTTDTVAANVLLKHSMAAQMAGCTVPPCWQVVKDSAALVPLASPVCRQDVVIVGFELAFM